jgi:thioredoxin-like negative regulator of GroEL
MDMRAHLVLSAAVMGVLTMAAPTHAKDRNGFQAISAKDFDAAERRLTAERRIYPNKPELMINLASVYRHTGRVAQARALYAAVLEQEPVMLDMPSGREASSHDLAELGLALLSSQDLASR